MFHKTHIFMSTTGGLQNRLTGHKSDEVVELV